MAGAQKLLAVVPQRTKADKVTHACFSEAAKLVTLVRTLFCSTASFNAESQTPPLQSCRRCTHPHPAVCALDQLGLEL